MRTEKQRYRRIRDQVQYGFADKTKKPRR